MKKPKRKITIDPRTRPYVQTWNECHKAWKAFYEHEKSKLPGEEEIRDELLRIKAELSQQSPTYADIAHAMKQAKAIHDRIRGSNE